MAQSFKLKQKLLLASVFLMASSHEAAAAQISNLSSRDQMIEIEVADGYRQVLLKPGEVYRGLGQIDVRYRGSMYRIEYNMEYAIWEHEGMGPQVRRPVHNRMN